MNKNLELILKGVGVGVASAVGFALAYPEVEPIYVAAAGLDGAGLYLIAKDLARKHKMKVMLNDIKAAQSEPAARVAIERYNAFVNNE